MKVAPTPALNRSTHALGVVMRQRQLQPFVANDKDLFALANTCSTLRPMAPWFPTNPGFRAAHLLARQIAHDNHRSPVPIREYLLALNTTAMGPRATLFEDCRTLVWMADYWRDNTKVSGASKFISPERRRQCLSVMFAAVYQLPLADGFVACDKARSTDYRTLAEVLTYEAIFAVQYATLLAVDVSVAASGTVYFGTLGLKAAKLGTVVGKAKTVAFFALSGGTAMVGAVGAYGVYRLGKATWLLFEDAHIETMGTTYSKDMLLCELVSGRRYSGRGACRET